MWLTAWLTANPHAFADGARIGEYLDLSAVRSAVERWQAGRGDTRQLWRWVNTELWPRAFS